MKFALVLSTLAIFTASMATASAQSDTPAAPAPARAAHAAMGTTAAADAQKGGKPYFIEFRARSAMSYGHTFAVIGRNGQKLTKANVVGLHPATESSVPWVVGHFIVVPSETGWSDGDIEDQYITAKYRIPLNEVQYKSLMGYVTDLKAKSPLWHAVLYNCNAFVGDIANHLGLKVPSSSLLMPKEYITELRTLNSAPRPAGSARTAQVN
jgi:hypothetical protein